MKTTVKTLPVNSVQDLRTTITLLIMLLCLFTVKISSASSGRPVIDSLTCLEIEGRVLIADENPSRECTIELISHNGQIDTIQLKDSKRKFRFLLNRNTSYAIRISKKGYVSKIVNVNTELKGDGSDNLHRFMFETPLLKEEDTVHLNKDVMEMPIAIIHFDQQQKCFQYDKEYTRTIKNEMRKNKPLNTGSRIQTNSKSHAISYTN